MIKKEWCFPVLGNGDFVYKKIDLSINGDLGKSNSENWYQYLEELPTTDPTIIHYGGYLEKRFFYSNEELFGKGATRRDIHLGIDLWAQENTMVYAPLEGVVHSIHYNEASLDYGHTVILKHKVGNQKFYSLYGHLSSWHCSMLKSNMKIAKGDSFCKIGGHAENGGWPPHLHLQLINNLGDYAGDYPGVSSALKIDFFRNNCPDPSPLI